AACAVRLHRRARAGPRLAGPGSLRTFWYRGARNAVRPAVGDQHGGQSAPHSRQGHDAALHLLRRLVADLARVRHGNAVGPRARAPGRGHGAAGRDDRAGRCGAAGRCGRESCLMQKHGGAGGRTPVLLAAGGTAGHLFPAEALAAALARRGAQVELATDARAAHFARNFPAKRLHVVPSATLRGRDPWNVARTAAVLAWGTLKSLGLLRRVRPAAVVGFGGFPTIPPVLAAALLRIPTPIPEPNRVMGRANRLLAPRVRAIATGFPGVLDQDPVLAAKVSITGDPVRQAVIEASAVPYPELDPIGPLHLLVFGGSQGARIMADIVPPA